MEHGGSIDPAMLRSLVDRGLSVREIAESLGRTHAAVRYWLSRNDLRTVRAANRRSAATDACEVHAVPLRAYEGRRLRCPRCVGEAVSARRRQVKEILVAEAGGACVLCGYDRYVGALQFHHVDPVEKSFGIANDGVTRSLAALRREAAKCVLLCGNCHPEVQAGVTQLSSQGVRSRG